MLLIIGPHDLWNSSTSSQWRLWKRADNIICNTLGACYRVRPDCQEAEWIARAGSDPTKLIEDLAKRKKVKTLGVSMGQGQEIIARNYLAAATTDGRWLLLQNTHLGLAYLSEVGTHHQMAKQDSVVHVEQRPPWFTYLC